MILSIDELIKELQEIRKKYGDIEVCCEYVGETVDLFGDEPRAKHRDGWLILTNTLRFHYDLRVICEWHPNGYTSRPVTSRDIDVFGLQPYFTTEELKAIREKGNGRRS